MEISFLGDLHLGNRAADRKAFRRALIEADKVILMGDMIEAITKKDKRHNKNDSILTYSEQITELIKDLTPYKDKILRYVIGNHCDTLLSISDIDTVDIVCNTLDIKSCYTEILAIDKVKIFITHGSGMAVTYPGVVNKMIGFARDHKADFYFAGHSHKLFDMLINHNPKPFTVVHTTT